MLKDFIKQILKLSPIPLTRNHRYDILTRKIISQLPSDSNCVDIGCYIGEILELMLKAAPDGKHFGIEPVPNQYDILVRKFKGAQNCTILNVAASDESGFADFNYVTSNPPYSGLKKREYDNEGEEDTTIQVRTELLDNLIPENLPVNLIKIDVEGAEMQVLRGASRIIQRDKPIVIFEHGLGASDYYGTTPEMIYAYFEDKGMQIFNLKAFLHKNNPLDLKEFHRQYHERVNYYFVAASI